VPARGCFVPERISSIPRLLGDCRVDGAPIPGWDGTAAQRLVDVLARDELPSRVALTRARVIREQGTPGAVPPMVRRPALSPARRRP